MKIVEGPEAELDFIIDGRMLLLEVVLASGAIPSEREARRLFEQRAVTMDGNVVEPTTPARAGTVVQIGKRKWIRLV